MKDKITKLIIFLIVLTVIELSSGCSGNQNQLGDNNKDLNISQVHTSKPINQSICCQSSKRKDHH